MYFDPNYVKLYNITYYDHNKNEQVHKTNVARENIYELISDREKIRAAALMQEQARYAALAARMEPVQRKDIDTDQKSLAYYFDIFKQKYVDCRIIKNHYSVQLKLKNLTIQVSISKSI